jgi:hypothetical protein
MDVRSEQVPFFPQLVPLPLDEDATELVLFGASDQDTLMDVDDPGAHRKRRRPMPGERVLMEGDPEVWNKDRRTHDN